MELGKSLIPPGGCKLVMDKIKANLIRCEESNSCYALRLRMMGKLWWPLRSRDSHYLLYEACKGR